MKREFKVENVFYDDKVVIGLAPGMPCAPGLAAHMIISAAELNVLTDEAYSAVAADKREKERKRQEAKIPQWWEAI